MTLLARWKERARSLQLDVATLYFAMRDPRVPWYAKALAALVVGYALSPIDLIPDPIPVLGYLDDLVLVPLGILAVRAMIPAPVLAECRAQASRWDQRPRNWVAAGIVILVWLLLLAAGIAWLVRTVVRKGPRAPARPAGAPP
jgi:uncharacterized membrane protein YkvA (DUF1232 family)